MVNHISLRYQLLLIFSNILIASVVSARPENSLKNLKKSESKDLIAASSVTMKSFKMQSVSPSSGGSGKYGYPYRVAPTLSPVISARADDNEAVVPQAKTYGSKLFSSEESTKRAPKKYKAPFATRRSGFDSEENTSSEKRLKYYREPKYRNFDELESVFRPRRIDINSPYSSYGYASKPSSRPPVSPRDPYLSPSGEPSDSFYPVPVKKVKSYPTPYSSEVPSYGAGKYEDPYDDVSAEYGKSGYSGPSSYPSSPGHYGYEDYTIESNKPIVGDIRKRLLDYAGASDLYEGEPDYLQEIARNKQKYGHVANDYYANGRHGYRGSYSDFPYVESKVSVLKKFRS
ncbi:hypothetical protein CDAR_539471 [Caerostris darwini]|uniref:Uncharacterized protein n=1 Tax=Caerostris darwini TaxID=1538125 RepID=A0AAV4MX35_9ARAC|nr:hypothetical protein CDAR_539471 [Caerostris darwini]